MWGPQESPYSAPQKCLNFAPHCPTAALKYSLNVAQGGSGGLVVAELDVEPGKPRVALLGKKRVCARVCASARVWCEGVGGTRCPERQ